jgi:hypothetical protein
MLVSIVVSRRGLSDRNRGLVRLLVRGLRKVKAVALWLAIAHNVVCGARLRAQKAATAV